MGPLADARGAEAVIRIPPEGGGHESSAILGLPGITATMTPNPYYVAAVLERGPRLCTSGSIWRRNRLFDAACRAGLSLGQPQTFHPRGSEQLRGRVRPTNSSNLISVSRAA